MTSLRRLPLCALVTVLLSSTILIAQQVAPAVRITQPIDASQLVTIKGSVHPLANAQNDRGPASPGMQLERLHLILKRSPAQETALRQLIQEQNTPGSANYHKWLTPAQFAAQFGPSSQDIATVENWLSDQGFNVDKLLPGNQALEVSGTVGQLQSSFHTQIRKYMVEGQLHYANAINPQIPAALAPVVGGFVSLNNFHYRHYAQKLGEATYDPSTGQARGSWTIGGGTFDYTKYQFPLTPADYAIQYDLPSTVKGDGQTIAIVNESNINIYLVNQFRSLFGLPANPPQIIIDGNDPGVDGINNPDGPNGASVEAYLDVEWAGATAPNATVDLVIAGDTSLQSGLALAAEHAVYSNVAPVVSISFGNCEANNGSSNAFWNKLWEQAAAQGQTVIVSSGDNGSAGCDFGGQYATHGLAVNGLASTPWNIAVGGTDFYYSSWNQGASAIDTQLGTYWNTTASNSTPTASIKGYIPEQPWNSSQYGLDLFNDTTSTSTTPSSNIGAGSGGASSAAICSGTYTSTGACSVTPTGYPKPAWQTGVTGIPGDGVRDLPDVSLFAANGYNDTYYAICATDADCQPASAGSIVQIFGVGGTSAAAPAFAGIMALVNQKYGRQGQANSILYPLKAQFPAAFHDITHGTNSVPCEFSPSLSANCISVTNAFSVSGVIEGQMGTGTTPAYNATAGYNLATGLGSIDAAQLITNWGNVTLGASAVTFNATPTSVTHGSPIAVSGAVNGTGTPTGSVAIMSDSTEPSQQGQSSFTLDSSGKYSGSLSTLPGGQYNIWASYSGDAKNGMSTSSPKIPITVNPEDSGIAFGLFQDTNIYSGSGSYLTSNITTPVDYGTQLMLSARVAPKAQVATVQTCTTSTTTACPVYTAPTGTIAFKDNGAMINTAVLNTEGDAEFNAPFSVGSHSVSASYNGDKSYNASTSTPSAITFTVAKDTPQINGATTITDQNGDLLSGTGQQTILTLIVENNAQATANSNSSISAQFPVSIAAPTGSVTLSGSTLSALSGTFPLSAGVDPSTGGQVGIATIALPATTQTGNYQVTVAYSGDSNYNSVPGSSNTTFQISILNFNGLGGLTSTTAVSNVSGSISPSTVVTITGTVTGQSGHPAPTGDVYLYSSGSYPTLAKLSAGSGVTSNFKLVVSSQTLLQGSNQLTVQYIGDSVYNPSAFVITNALSNSRSDFSLIPQSAIVPVTAGDTAGSSVVINLASINSFSGSVALTCATPAGLNFTCNITNPVSLTAGGSSTATLTITAPLNTAKGDYNVSVTGKDSTGEFIHTLAITADVTGQIAPTFALSNNGPITVDAGATTGNTATITVTPMAGFTGDVALTCAVTSAPAGAANPPTCVVTTSVSITGTNAATGTLTVTTQGATTGGAYVVTVTGKDTTQTITQTTAVTVNVAVPGLNLTNSGSITLTNPGDSGSATITATPSNGLTGTVNLACAVTSSPSGATSAPTCDFTGNPITITGTAAGTATLNVHSASATTLGAYQVTVTATAGTITTTTVVNVTVGVPDFSLSANPTSITVKAGATTGNTSAISITPKNGFTGNVTFSCSISPTAASAPATCNVSPSPVNVTNASPASPTLTITTTAATTAMNDHKPIFWSTAGSGLVFACALFFWIPKKRRSWLAMFVLLVFLGSIAGMACGGGGGGGGGNNGNPGTTPGSYTVTVTGTSGTLNHTTTVSLTVQ